MDIAMIQFSSGHSNGKRKMIIKTYSNLINSVYQINHKDIISLNKSDRILTTMDFKTLYGMSLFLHSIVSGCSIVLVPGQIDTNNKMVLEMIAKYEVSVLVIFSSEVNFMLDNEVNLKYNLSSVKEILYIGVFADINQVKHHIETQFKFCRNFRAGNK